MNCLVTGGAGFIGSHIVQELLKSGHTVRVLDNLLSGSKDNLREAKVWNDIEFVEGDIRSPFICLDAVKGIDVVLHQAALNRAMRSIEDPLSFNEVNIGGTLNLLKAVQRSGVAKFIFASSSSVYGDNVPLPTPERVKLSPASPYGVTKMVGEEYCHIFSEIYGFQTLCLRYFSVYGPRQPINSEYSAVISKILRAITEDKKFFIYGDGDQSRAFTFVEDIAKVNALAVRHEQHTKHKIVNVASPTSCTINDLVSLIDDLMHTSIHAIHMDPRPGEFRNSSADVHELAGLTNGMQLTTLKEGLERMIAWWMKDRV